MVCFVQGSTAVVLTCVYRGTCIAAGQNPPGLGQDFGGATSATSYTSFSAKGKAKSARSALCSSVEFIFTCHELQPQGRTEEFAEQLDLAPAFGWRSGPPLR